ncbi:S-adenosyl-L-methionine-dependent methyltransferase [Tricharina praecox]|uniref:S-adenosyl-L-methionine-dependent methyltransferase n=1 Tax=Tricharina praecox TaxID=43433 RepID=UPI00221EF5D4|nr:S-adenosyl-L-methionine-dependent methyltransferase [Tricharina praecox]KAI5855487.1 S-adenosyl-L-methionine-dependent methyltransferase [Tricharina praecox]
MLLLTWYITGAMDIGLWPPHNHRSNKLQLSFPPHPPRPPPSSPAQFKRFCSIGALVRLLIPRDAAHSSTPAPHCSPTPTSLLLLLKAVVNEMLPNTELYSPAIEVDPAMYDEEDLGYESALSGYDSDTMCIASTMNEYLLENGRLYHTYYGPDKNILPLDEIEQDRMDLCHDIFNLMLEGLHLAPVESPTRILDVGTGTGVWAIQVAEEYPQAEVIGMDLSPIQREWVPPNCRFEVDDAERDFTYQRNSFDLVHVRNLGQCIDDWERLMSEIYQCTKPGGYIEWCELGGTCHSDDNTLADNNPTKLWFDCMVRAVAMLGRPASITHILMHDFLERAGFVDIEVAQYKHPLAPWPKDKRLKQIGAMNLIAGVTGYHAYGMALFTRVLGFHSDMADKICRDCQVAQFDKSAHIYTFYYVVYARKPTRDEAAANAH